MRGVASTIVADGVNVHARAIDGTSSRVSNQFCPRSPALRPAIFQNGLSRSARTLKVEANALPSRWSGNDVEPQDMISKDTPQMIPELSNSDSWDEDDDLTKLHQNEEVRVQLWI